MGKFRCDYAAKNIAIVPAILSVAGKIHSEFLHLLWVMADVQTVKYFCVADDDYTSGLSASNGFELAHSAVTGMRLALPLHMLLPYALICWYMAPLTPRAPLLFAPGRQQILSSAALSTSLTLVKGETMV